MPRSRSKSPPPVAPPNRALLIALAITAMTAFLAFGTGDILTNAPTSDETTHLVAGYSYLHTHDYRLNPEHPPLLKKFAALPLLSMKLWPRGFREPADGTQSFAMFREAWSMALANPAMAEWSVSEYVLYGLRDVALRRVGGQALKPPTDVAYARADFLNDAHAMMVRGRLMMLLIGASLGIAIYVCSYLLWGIEGATISLLLFCFDPNFIAHGALVTTDVGSSLFIFLAIFFFWRISKNFSAANVILFALTAAAAQTTKFSAVLLIPMLLAIALVELIRRRQLAQISIALAAAAVATIAIIWAAYDFRFSTAPNPRQALDDEAAVRKTLQIKALEVPTFPTGHLPVQDAVERWEAMKRLAKDAPPGWYTEEGLRRAMRTTSIGFAGRVVLFANEHRLLPEAFLYGFASAAGSSTARSSYLNGRYSIYGFPAFFFWTFIYKTPIPIIMAVLIGVPLALLNRERWGDIGFLFWPAATFAAFAVASNINIGHRHIFPVLPFVYALCGSLGTRWREMPRRARTIAAVIALAAIAIGPVVVLSRRPAVVVNQHLAYLNEIAGGPIAGWDKLTDSNFDWGQDLKRLVGWVRAHGVRDPIFLVYFSSADPRYYGLVYEDLRNPTFPTPQRPGYFAISQLDYLGVLFDTRYRDFWRDYLERVGARRVGTAGYSIFIYRIDHP